MPKTRITFGKNHSYSEKIQNIIDFEQKSSKIYSHTPKFKLISPNLNKTNEIPLKANFLEKIKENFYQTPTNKETEKERFFAINNANTSDDSKTSPKFNTISNTSGDPDRNNDSSLCILTKNEENVKKKKKTTYSDIDDHEASYLDENSECQSNYSKKFESQVHININQTYQFSKKRETSFDLNNRNISNKTLNRSATPQFKKKSKSPNKDIANNSKNNIQITQINIRAPETKNKNNPSLNIAKKDTKIIQKKNDNTLQLKIPVNLNKFKKEKTISNTQRNKAEDKKKVPIYLSKNKIKNIGIQESLSTKNTEQSVENNELTKENIKHFEMQKNLNDFNENAFGYKMSFQSSEVNSKDYDTYPNTERAVDNFDFESFARFQNWQKNNNL